MNMGEGGGMFAWYVFPKSEGAVQGLWECISGKLMSALVTAIM